MQSQPNGAFGEDDDIQVLWIRKIRTYNALARAEVRRISDLMRMTDREILATPGIGAAGLEDIKQAIDRFVGDGIDALRAGQLPPAAPSPPRPLEPGRHPIDVAIDALRAAGDSMPDDGYSGWRAMFHRMADTLPDQAWRERHWGEV